MMMSDKMVMGLKETKEVVDFAIALGHGVEGALEDKQITIADVALFFPAFIKLVPAIEGADQIALEFKLANQEEIDELKAYVNGKLDLKDEQLEKFIEDAFGLVLSVWSMVKTYFIKSQPEVQDVDSVDEVKATE